MQVKAMLDILGASFYTGIWDSLLNPLCNSLKTEYGVYKGVFLMTMSF